MDAFQLDKNWGEARLYTELFPLFQTVLTRSSEFRQTGEILTYVVQVYAKICFF